VIKTRWKILPRNQCEGIKKYIVGLIIKTSSDPEVLEKEKTYLNKLNMILVQVREKSITIHFTLNGILQCLIALNLYVFWLLEALVLKRDFWQHHASIGNAFSRFTG
jgi:hypothetical protein